MKINKTFLFAVFTIIVVVAVYELDYKAEEKKTSVEQGLVFNQITDGINYIQVDKGDFKVGVQKSGDIWNLIEPIQDAADSKNIEEIIEKLSSERKLSVAYQAQKDLTQDELKQFGLDKPIAEFNFKNSSGKSKKISVGSVRNYEGNSYIRIDSENRIILASSFWYLKSEKELIYYREKKLYRAPLGNIKKIKATSLRGDFELELVNGNWVNENNSIVLDQNKIRELLKKISDTEIVEYVFEGEPSTILLKEKGLDKTPVKIELYTENDYWSAALSLRPDERALYALTERPTFLVKIDIPSWETFGDLNLDELRDRTSALAFNAQEVQNIYYKNNNAELDLKSDDGAWKSNSMKTSKSNISDDQVNKVISRVHDLKISEFIDNPAVKNKFEGRNMLIFKTANEKLLLQLNWGPSFKMKKDGKEKEYYYARTHQSDQTFAIEKNLIDSLDIEKMASLKNIEDLKTNN